MVSSFMLSIWFLTLVPVSYGLNVLMITLGAAGHVIPMFELAKSMKNHNVTFITALHAQSYINFESYAKLSSFRIIYTNDSTDAFINEKKREKQVVEYFMNHSLLESVDYMISRISPVINTLMTKSVNLLMSERYDVIIGTSLTIGTHLLCKQANASCVIIILENQLNRFDVNQPISNSLLSSKHLTELKYRIYNFVLTLRLTIPLFKTVFKMYYRIFHSFPQVPGPFYEVFTLRNILRTKSNCLKLISLPPTLYPPSSLYHDTKYLGGFVDNSSIEYVENDLTRWIKSKPPKSIVYVAFGSISVLNQVRMKNLIYGLAEFLLQKDSISAFLAFRNTNYENYQIVLNEMEHDQYRQILMNDQRSLWNGFNYQFSNAISIYHSGVGESLFVPPSLWKLFLNPLDFHDYVFSASDVTTKLLAIWRNTSYEQAVRMMSLEIKHAGGVRKAVEEIEHFVNLNGSLDRYKPFYNTLPFYQRYLLDIIFVCIILPSVIIYYLCVKYCNRNRKAKKD
ncbi:unnamed protein product [Rotaria sp. Silwood1]|nr:unnamed protein product [Rotaria sp. Silwood1]